MLTNNYNTKILFKLLNKKKTKKKDNQQIYRFTTPTRGYSQRLQSKGRMGTMSGLWDTCPIKE
jgi:hypothetical protein